MLTWGSAGGVRSHAYEFWGSEYPPKDQPGIYESSSANSQICSKLSMELLEESISVGVHDLAEITTVTDTNTR